LPGNLSEIKTAPKKSGPFYLATNRQLLTEVLRVNVDAGLGVVNQVPSRMVRIVIHYDVVRASPAPVSRVFPIPGRDFKSESTGKPETVETEVKAGEPIWVARAKICESAVRVGIIEVEPRVIAIIMAIPMIVGDVRPFVYFAALISVHVTRTARRSGWRWRRNVTAVSAMLLSTATLCYRAHSQQ
jgi:hypothetical protein